MLKRLVPVFILVTTVISIAQTGSKTDLSLLQKQFKEAGHKFEKANRLADKAGDDSLKNKIADNAFTQALTAYNQLLPQLSIAGNDSMYIAASTNTGILYHYFDSTELALQSYLNAAHRRDNNTKLPDSIFFQPLLFCGSLFYSSGAYDSAIIYLKKAEQVKAGYTVYLEDEYRLYNLLGVIYYENGNLKQSLNYVQKALALHTKNPGYDKTLATNYQMNIASVLIKLEDFETAKEILEKLKNNNSYPDEAIHKLGFIKLKEKHYKEALQLFSQVSYPGGRKQVDLLINQCMALIGVREIDSARMYLLKAKAEAIRTNGNRKTITNGTLLKTEAELYVASGEYEKAAEACQLSIINFCPDFTDSIPYSNPEKFSSAIAYIDLFNTLTEKGAILGLLYNQSHEIKELEAAVASYRAAFQLAAYVEKTYDSDEARLFLNNIKYANHSKPIDFSIQLFELTGKKKYLEEVYYFDQQNKASILSLNVRENEIQGHSAETNRLIQEATTAKAAITRFTLKASAITDSIEVSKLLSARMDKEIELSKIQQKIKQDPAWQQLNLRDQVPSIGSLQKKIDNSTAIISWHLSETEIIGLIITRSKFDFIKVALTKGLLSDIEIFKASLHAINDGSRFGGTAVSKNIYHSLFSQLQSRLMGIERMIIIPDDELHYLPFEALQDENGSYLIQRYSVQYLWSTALFQQTKKYNIQTGTLSFAPFANNGYSDSSGNSFSRLSASGTEVGNLSGLVLLNDKASKESFLALANHYPIIHLATHASANNTTPGQSFIAFNPVYDNDYKLYEKEIYNLRLDSTQLLILSACETGTGQLVRGEGLMSLSRAFTYAGCSDIITSLWKAEDNTTSYISQKLHSYLAEGMTKDKALQQAKLDFLNDKNTDPRLKTPNYWAHLVFIGSYETTSHSSNWPWIAVAIILLAFIYRWLMKKSSAV